MSAETDNLPTILLLQARAPEDPILQHEFECFVERTPYPPSVFRAVNMVEEGAGPELLEGVDMVTVGGAGDYSVVEGEFPWYDEMLATMRAVVERDVPMFASCFGLHALVAALGGELRRIPECSEVGTFEIRLTEEGAQDPFFGQFPERFDAQLGHKDSIVDLPDGFVRLAASERCDHQAVRIPDRPIFATQFHPELSARDNIERYARYIQNYKGIDESYDDAMERAQEIHRESPVANQLLERFIATYVDGGAATG